MLEDDKLSQNGPEDVHEPADPVEFISADEVLERTIAQKARAIAPPQEGLSQGAFILLGTLFFFFNTELLKDSLTGVVVIIAVLVIHELGHYVGMLLFGYGDPQTFFLPGFGAAVAGKNQNASGWQRAVVSLMGPVPGIFLGLAVGLVYLNTMDVIAAQAAVTLIVFNAFNLLPLLQLDGGRFFYALLFRRSRFAEFAMRAGAVVFFAAVAFALSNWVFGFLAVSHLMFMGSSWKVASAANELRWKGSITPDAKTGDVPEEQLYWMIRCTRRHVPLVTDPEVLAKLVRQVWQRLVMPPPGCLVSILLAFVYGITFLSIFAGPRIAVKVSRNMRTIVVRGKGGKRIRKVQVVAIGVVQSECTLDAGDLYHGEATYYWFLRRTKSAVGSYRRGRRHGLWRWFDQKGSLQKEETFEKGRLVKRKFREGSGESARWVTRLLAELPTGERDAFEREAAAPPRGLPEQRR